jgi:hypothetical protein
MPAKDELTEPEMVLILTAQWKLIAARQERGIPVDAATFQRALDLEERIHQLRRKAAARSRRMNRRVIAAQNSGISVQEPRHLWRRLRREGYPGPAQGGPRNRRW